MEIALTISRAAVLQEVAQKTNYYGAKMVTAEDPAVYERVRTIEEDHPELLQLFNEARTDLVELLLGKVADEGMGAGNDIYTLALYVSDTFNVGLNEALQLKLFFYFVYAIIARWFGFVNKAEMESAALQAKGYLDGLQLMQLGNRAFVRKMFYP